MSYSNTNSSNGGEIIRISINSTSNAISSHLSNLEGFSCTNETTTAKPSSAFCDWIVTHSNNSNNIITPRMIIIDNVKNIQIYHNNHSNSESVGCNISSNIMNDAGDSLVETWDGKIEQIQNKEQYGLVPQSYNATSIDNNAFQNFHYHTQQLINTTNQYKKEPERNENHKRYVDWDDLGEEEEDEDNKLKKQYRDKMKLNHLQQNISECWSQCLETKMKAQNSNDDINWYNYLLPPYPTPQESCFITIDDDVNLTKMNDTIEDSIRIQLETCDSISGFQLLCDNNNSVLSNKMNNLTKSVYNYLHDECKSSGIFSSLSSSNFDMKTKTDQKDFMIHQLLYSTLIEQSNVVLPINISSSIFKPQDGIYQHFPLFYSTAMISSLLHSISLPYRISSRSEDNLFYCWNRNIEQPDQIYKRIPFKQYLQSMIHFNHFNIVEADVLYPSESNHDGLVSYSFETQYSTISNCTIDPLIPIPTNREEHNYLYPTVHEYHTLNYTQPLQIHSNITSNKQKSSNNSSQCNMFNQNIIQSYQPKQYMSFSTNYTLPPSCAYWNHLLNNASSSSIIPYSVLSNSTRSYKSIQKNKNLFSKLVNKHDYLIDDEEEDDLLEVLEFWNTLESSYAPSSILLSSYFTDDDYFDDLE